MFSDLNFSTTMNAQLQRTSFDSLYSATSGFDKAGAELTLGINEVLARTDISGLGISNKKDLSLTEEEIERIKERIKTRTIDTSISGHVMKKKHGWTNKCRQDCILQVANNIKVNKAWFTKGGIPIIRGNGNCRHGCLIEVRMSIPPNQINWSIGTSFHKDICTAK